MSSSLHRQNETLDERIKRVVQEEISIVPYDPNWPALFKLEKEHLLKCLPQELVRRIEHFGSTAVPGLSAKPIIDIFIQVTSLERAKKEIVEILELQGYEYFWRPSLFKGQEFYIWFIKRGDKGIRTHHIHVVENDIGRSDELIFRDYLMEHPSIAAEYQELKLGLAEKYRNDREAYTRAKTEFIKTATADARRSGVEK